MNVAGDGPIKLIVNLWKASVTRSSHSEVRKTLHSEMTGSEAVLGGGHWKEDEGCLNQVHGVMLWVYSILIDARKWPYVTQFSAIKK